MPTVIGAIRDKWVALGSTQSFLGQPFTDELTTPDGTGRYNHFQGGSIFWTPRTGAHEVHGQIRDKWAALGWERSFLGYPLTDELGTPDRVGRFNHLEGGSIYWTPQTGATTVSPPISGACYRNLLLFRSCPAETDPVRIWGQPDRKESSWSWPRTQGDDRCESHAWFHS